ncbi:unnamed protein product [Hydatigera taeniaeformis]|uniref:Protein kinase domain-containing protein n=1 Tax=Hydatigena taeniaeformis TaxID=6205 RepID=A0A0R3X7F2_HYDTA|nr:unnamed protein product [Hydatigera taeniaeformis]
MCPKDPSETTWSVRYKALGCYDRDNVPHSSLECRPNSIDIRLCSNLSNEARLRDDKITLAQQKELIETLQLSDSDEENIVEDRRSSSRNKLTPVASKPNIIAQNLSSHMDMRLLNLPQLISPLPSGNSGFKASASPIPLRQIACSRDGDNLDMSKSRKRTLESAIRLEHPPKPSVYSPLAVRVSEGTVDSSHYQYSVDTVGALTSLPAHRLGNQENVPSVEKHVNSFELYVRRVLADAEAFCKPLQHLPGNFRNECKELSGKDDPRDISLCLNNGKRALDFPRLFSLKAVSPLPETFVGLGLPVDESQPSPPKRLLLSEDLVTEQPFNSQKQRAIEEPKSAHNSSWILTSVGTLELRPRLFSILLGSSRRLSSYLDKLASLRFLLRSIRTTKSDLHNVVTRNLTGVLLAPPASDQLPRFVETGTETTPKHTTISATQYDSEKLVNSAAQTTPQAQTSAFTNTSPSHFTFKRVSVSTNTDPLFPGAMENGFSDGSSADYCLKKVIGNSDAAMERVIRSAICFPTTLLLICFLSVEKFLTFSFEASTEEEQLTQASNLDTEAATCWSKLVKFVAATSSSSSSSGSGCSMRPFVCSCAPEAQRLIHSLFSQTDFTSYPEKILASTRHLLVAALMSTSELDARRRYEQALESLAKTASRMRRAESKLLRRAWVAIQRSGGVDPPITGVAELGGDAKRWSDLWYSALARVRAVVSDKFHQLIADKERELRKSIAEDPFLKHLKVLNTEEDFLTVCSSPSPTPSRNGSIDCRSCILSNPDGFNESRSDMCTVPRLTLERLVKIFQITSLAGESMRSRQESELILPTDRFAVFGCEGTRQQQPHYQLPIFVASASSTNMTPLIVYIDSVLQLHRRLLSCLAVCPEMPQYQPSVDSTPKIKKLRSPLAPPPAPPPISKHSTKQKIKHQKSPVPPPPPFEDLPIRPHGLAASKRSRHRKHRQSSQSDETVSSELSEVTKKRKRKHRELASPSGKTSVPSRMRGKYKVEDKQSRNHNSRCSSVAPLRKNFDRDEGDATDDSILQRHPHQDHKRTRGRSVVPPLRERPGIHINGDGGGSMETYSPRKNSLINASSYSPSRPAFSNERQSGGGAINSTYEPTYIPSVPAPSSASRRTLLQELPPKPHMDPDFYAKWMGRGSSSRR